MKTFKFQNRFGPGFYLVNAENAVDAWEGLKAKLVENGYPARYFDQYYIDAS